MIYGTLIVFPVFAIDENGNLIKTNAPVCLITVL